MARSCMNLFLAANGARFCTLLQLTACSGSSGRSTLCLPTGVGAHAGTGKLRCVQAMENNSYLCCAGRWLLSRFVIHAAEMTAGLQEKLPPTDSRRRRDLRLLERAVYGEVNHDFVCRAAALAMPRIQLSTPCMPCGYLCLIGTVTAASIHCSAALLSVNEGDGPPCSWGRQTLPRGSWRTWTGRTALL